MLLCSKVEREVGTVNKAAMSMRRQTILEISRDSILLKTFRGVRAGT